MKLLFIFGLLLIGLILLINYWFSPKPSIIPSLDIKGDRHCITKTNEAFTLLKNKAPDHYENVAKYVSLIKCGWISSLGGWYQSNDLRSFTVSMRAVNADPIEYAGLIAHETCHAKQAQEKRPIEESECENIQEEVLKKIGD